MPKLLVAASVLAPAPVLSIYYRLAKIFIEKIMVAEEVFVNFYNLKILISLLKYKKVIFKVSYKLSGAGGK